MAHRLLVRAQPIIAAMGFFASFLFGGVRCGCAVLALVLLMTMALLLAFLDLVLWSDGHLPAPHLLLDMDWRNNNFQPKTLVKQCRKLYERKRKQMKGLSADSSNK